MTGEDRKVKKITTLTEEQKSRFPEWVSKWLKIGLSTERADFDAAESAGRACYRSAGLPEPIVVLRMGSPLAATIGGVYAVNLLQQVRQQVRQQVGQQVEQQVWQQVWQQVGQQVGDAVWNNSSSYGLWAGWMSWVSFFRDVCRWEDDALSRFALAEALANTGWQWWHSDVLALSDRPRFIKRNAAGRLHSDEGPAIEYRDGWSIYAWHGYRLPDTHYHLITARDKITPAMIEAEPNAELRRIALEIFGFDRFFEARGGKVIDKDEVFGRPRRLLELKLKGEKIRVMDVYNGSLEPDGTRRRFMLGAVAGVNTVHEAVAASYGLNPGAYREAVRT